MGTMTAGGRQPGTDHGVHEAPRGLPGGGVGACLAGRGPGLLGGWWHPGRGGDTLCGQKGLPHLRMVSASPEAGTARVTLGAAGVLYPAQARSYGT